MADKVNLNTLANTFVQERKANREAIRALTDKINLICELLQLQIKDVSGSKIAQLDLGTTRRTVHLDIEE